MWVILVSQFPVHKTATVQITYKIETAATVKILYILRTNHTTQAKLNVYNHNSYIHKYITEPLSTYKV
jgi:hypothetical protein